MLPAHLTSAAFLIILDLQNVPVAIYKNFADLFLFLSFSAVRALYFLLVPHMYGQHFSPAPHLVLTDLEDILPVQNIGHSRNPGDSAPLIPVYNS